MPYTPSRRHPPLNNKNIERLNSGDSQKNSCIGSYTASHSSLSSGDESRQYRDSAHATHEKRRELQRLRSSSLIPVKQCDRPFRTKPVSDKPDVNSRTRRSSDVGTSGGNASQVVSHSTEDTATNLNAYNISRRIKQLPLSVSSPSARSSHFPLFWRKRRDVLPLGVRGFDNLGNTCYMNSALQCLVSTQLLSEYFFRRMFETEVNHDNPLGSKGHLAFAFADLVTLCRESSATSLNLSLIKHAVSKFNPLFRGYNQHDAQEFLAVFLDGIHEDLNRATLRDKPKEPDIDRAAMRSTRFERLAAAAWQRYLCRNKSFLVDLFQGQLESRVTCLRCNDFSLKFEPFMYLSLPVQSSMLRRILSLEDALTAFSRPERLTDACWNCPKCRIKVPVEKRISLVKLPPVLIIHFKRFEFDSRGFRKIEEFINVSMEALNMQHVVQQKHAPVYDLYGVIDHSGHAMCGHYTAACLWEGRWFRFDDSVVQEIEPASVINENNYVLFFQRRDVPNKPDLLRRQTLRHPENWPHSLRSDSIEEIKRTGLQNLVKWNSRSLS